MLLEYLSHFSKSCLIICASCIVAPVPGNFEEQTLIEVQTFTLKLYTPMWSLNHMSTYQNSYRTPGYRTNYTDPFSIFVAYFGSSCCTCSMDDVSWSTYDMTKCSFSLMLIPEWLDSHISFDIMTGLLLLKVYSISYSPSISKVCHLIYYLNWILESVPRTDSGLVWRLIIATVEIIEKPF